MAKATATQSPKEERLDVRKLDPEEKDLIGPFVLEAERAREGLQRALVDVAKADAAFARALRLIEPAMRRQETRRRFDPERMEFYTTAGPTEAKATPETEAETDAKTDQRAEPEDRGGEPTRRGRDTADPPTG